MVMPQFYDEMYDMYVTSKKKYVISKPTHFPMVKIFNLPLVQQLPLQVTNLPAGTTTRIIVASLPGIRLESGPKMWDRAMDCIDEFVFCSK